MRKADLPTFDLIDPDLRALAEDLFARLRADFFDGVGVSRETYGPSETAAMR